MVREGCTEKVLFRTMAQGYLGKSLGHAHQRLARQEYARYVVGTRRPV